LNSNERRGVAYIHRKNRCFINLFERKLKIICKCGKIIIESSKLIEKIQALKQAGLDNMEIKFEKIYERDVDLLIMSFFTSGKEVCNLFYKEMELCRCTVESIEHSATGLHGESDVAIVLKKGDRRHLLMIEDKIDAPAQPEQYERYIERGDRQMQEGKVDGYTIFIVAPKAYLKSNGHAHKYDKQVSYEDILEECKKCGDVYAIGVLERAISKQKNPGEVDEAVTKFWNDYYEYKKHNAKEIKMYWTSGTRGPNATWPSFKTKIKGARILHKSEKGYVDLQFSGKIDLKNELERIIAPYQNGDMNWEDAGKSAALRIEVPKVDFSKSFDSQIESINVVFEAVRQLNKVVDSLVKDKVKIP